MENQQALQPPANASKKRSEIECSIDDAMQKWLSNAQASKDARDRVAVTHGISRGVFGSLHLGADHRYVTTCVEPEFSEPEYAEPETFTELETFKRAA